MNMNPFANGTMNPMLLPKTKARKCNGEEGAKAFPIGPDSSDTIIDETGPFIWYVETDENAQKRVLTRFRIKQDDPLPPPDYGEMNDKLTRIMEKLENVDNFAERLNKLEEALK